MGVSPRHFAAAAFLVAAVSVAVVASPPRGSSAAAAAPTAATFPPCAPQTDGRVLKDPPLWVPTAANERTITLHARKTNPKSNAFCYVVDGQKSYFEAPTIEVHQGETFRLILKNELVSAPGAAMSGMAMSPQPAPTAADGCDQMGTMPILPDNATGALGTGATPDPRLATATEIHDKDDTNIHTHGWDVSPSVDNVFKSTSHSHSAAGGPRSCVYEFAVPLSQSAGTYWYHAHMHGVSNKQVGGGLAGALIVLPAKGPAPDSRVLIIKNLTPAESAAEKPLRFQTGAVARSLVPNAEASRPSPTFPPPPAAGKVWSGIPFNSTTTGPCGWGPSLAPAPKAPDSPTMVNGISIPQPGSTTPPATLVLDKRERVRVINASANGYVYLMMRVRASGSENLLVVARDGVDVDPTPGEGRPLAFKQLLLGPGNRADLLISPERAQRTLMSRYTCTGALGNSEPTQAIATIPGAAASPRTLAAVTPLAASKTAAAAFVKKYLPRVSRQRELTFTQYDSFAHFYVTDTTNRDAPGFGERPLWLQASATPKDPDHYMLPNITVTQDDTEEWTLVNAAAEIHAFHIHQMTFTTLSTDDPELMSEFKNVLLDVVPLPPARPYLDVVYTDPATKLTYPALTPTKTKILINFGVVHPGTFVYHCHMLAHEDSGMMGIITVLPRKTAKK
jgi:FtsP/CotA-like multicopper oxidase with cupredoxin domain